MNLAPICPYASSSVIVLPFFSCLGCFSLPSASRAAISSAVSVIIPIACMSSRILFWATCITSYSRRNSSVRSLNCAAMTADFFLFSAPFFSTLSRNGRASISAILSPFSVARNSRKVVISALMIASYSSVLHFSESAISFGICSFAHFFHSAISSSFPVPIALRARINASLRAISIVFTRSSACSFDNSPIASASFTAASCKL